MGDVFYGAAHSQSTARNSQLIYRLLADDPAIAWYGRWVALVWTGPDCLGRMEALGRLQGMVPVYWLPEAEAPMVEERITSWGFAIDRFELVSSDGPSTPHARDLLAAHRMPDDIEILRIGRNSSDAELDAFAEMALSQDVVPPPASVLRGLARTSVILMARERGTGRAVATAGSIQTFHPASPYADHAFWGMLTTVPDRRGEKIALLLGAEAMVTMERENGFSRFMTGVRPDNAPSMALCAKVSMKPLGHPLFGALDPNVFGTAKSTK